MKVSQLPAGLCFVQFHDLRPYRCKPDDCGRRSAGTSFQLTEKYGRPGWNRTSNPQLRRLMLYPIELRAHERPARILDAGGNFIIANHGADSARMKVTRRSPSAQRACACFSSLPYPNR